MKNKLLRKLIIILIVVASALLVSVPYSENIKQGLDLKGGAELIYRFKIDSGSAGSDEEKIDRALEVIRIRIDPQGVMNVLVQEMGNQHILIQIPGVNKEALREVKQILSRPGVLHFRLVNDDPEAIRYPQPRFEFLPERDVLAEGQERVLVGPSQKVTGENVRTTNVVLSRTISEAGYVVELGFDTVGQKMFADLTRDHIGEKLAIVMDGKIQSAPTIVTVCNGLAIISGGFDYEEAHGLATVLLSGSLPVKLHLDQESWVGPSLGQDSIQKGIGAFTAACVIIVVFMMGYYRIAGVVAVLVLGMNLVIVMGGIAILDAVLTLPGIAGLVLTIGMAVDANILIFERIREEQNKGACVSEAIRKGFDRTISTVLDANITTFFVAMILYWIGAGAVKGFAVVLMLGIVSSLFTSLYAARFLFGALVHLKVIKHHLCFAKCMKVTSLRFLNMSKPACCIAFVVLVVGMSTLFVSGKKMYDVDFNGGVLVQMKLEIPLLPEEVKNIISESMNLEAQVQTIQSNTQDSFGQHSNYAVRVNTESMPDQKQELAGAFTHDEVEDDLKNAFDEYGISIERTSMIGPAVASGMKVKAFTALGASSMAILLYMKKRFSEFRYGVAAVVALVHDIFTTIGIFSILGMLTPWGGKIDLAVVAALLTIAGYSLNDTIVLFDRIRENKTKCDGAEMTDIIDLSISQTLTRTLLTSITTLMVVVVLLCSGVYAIANFATILLIGVLAGTFSSIFIASPALIWVKGFKSQHAVFASDI